MIEHLNYKSFREKIYDFESNHKWKYEGKVPCLIDFYASSCDPCQKVDPLLDELSAEYKGKITIYKVDTEKEIDLKALFHVQSIPSLLFVPLKGTPQIAFGALPRESFVRAFTNLLKV